MFIRKFKSERGVTGADVAAAVTLIVLTMGVVTALYINLTNKSKDNLRYSAATRIATQIVENIQSECFDEVIYRCSTDAYRKIDKSTNGKIFGVTVPVGYSAEVTLGGAVSTNTGDPDVLRNLTVKVTYTISGSERNIVLYTIKQKELLEQTNRPDLNLLPGYSDNSGIFYPIKKVGSDYLITTESDPEWYNYDITNGKRAALAWRGPEKQSLGTNVTSVIHSGTNRVFAWVPRFGSTNTGSVNSANLGYVYKATDILIQFGESRNVIGYFITGTENGENFNTTNITSYDPETFTSNDGLYGGWYCLNDTSLNTNTVINKAYDKLKLVVGFTNLP